MLRELAVKSVQILIGFVDFVNRDDDRNAGGFSVVNRLNRLRHHAVVGGDNQDHDIGQARAA